jgi:hypothetical protein
VFWTWYNTNDYNTCRTKEIIYPKMPNKGLRKMQAKPLLNITKQFKTKIMSTISNFVNTVIAIIKGDDAEVIGLKIQKELLRYLLLKLL